MKKEYKFLAYILNLVTLVIVIVFLNQYKYHIVYEMQRNINNPDNLRGLISKIPMQMSWAFIFGDVYMIIVYIINTYTKRSFVKKN